MIYYQISKSYPKKLGQAADEILGRYRKTFLGKIELVVAGLIFFGVTPPLQPVQGGGSVKGGKRNS
jgi:hypothetical protein